VSSRLQTPAALPPGKKATGTHWVGGWVDPRAGLDDVEKRKILTLPGLELRSLGRPARNQSLYRPRYPDSGKVKLFLCLTNLALRHEGVWGVDVQIYNFLTSAVVGTEW
jgi:hypothetical protein